jgi:hypothetical protein
MINGSLIAATLPEAAIRTFIFLDVDWFSIVDSKDILLHIQYDNNQNSSRLRTLMECNAEINSGN